MVVSFPSAWEWVFLLARFLEWSTLLESGWHCVACRCVWRASDKSRGCQGRPLFVSFGIMHGLKLIHCALYIFACQWARAKATLAWQSQLSILYSVSQFHVHIRKGVFLAYWGCRRWPVTVAGVLCQLDSKREGGLVGGSSLGARGGNYYRPTRECVSITIAAR